MDWSKEMCMALAKLYRSKDSLWNPLNPDHHIKPKRNDAWTEVAKQLSGMFGKPLTMTDCKKKMDCILSSFRREKAKIKKMSIERGGEHTSSWFLFDALAFLMDRNGHRPTPIASSTPVPHPPSVMQRNDIQRHVIHRNDIQGFDIQRNDIHRDDILHVHVSPPPLKVRRLQMENEQVEEIPKPVESAAEDECYSYGMYVANKLKCYSAYSRSAVQHAISDILFNADMGYYDRTRSFVVNTHTEAAQCILLRHNEVNPRTQELKNEEHILSDLEDECVLP